MGFDFGQFLGGMSRQISTNIEEAKKFNREKQFRLDMLAEEEATKERLAVAAERRAKREQDEQNLALLKSMNISDAKAGWILKGGNTAVSNYVDYAQAALARGINPDDMLESSMFVEDHNDPRNEAAMMATVRDYKTKEPFTVRQDIMTSVLGEVEKPKEPKQYSSLEAGHAGTYSLLQNAKSVYASDPSKPNQAEVTRLEGVLKEWKTKIEEDIAMRREDGEDDAGKDDQYFNDDSYGRIEKDQLMFALNDYDFPNLDGKITAKLEGRVGISHIAKLVAADNMEEIATVGKDKNGQEIVDSRMLGASLRIRENAERRLRSYGRSIVSTDGNPDAKTKTFGYLKNDKTETGELIPVNFKTAMKMANNGQLKEGDVIVVRVKENGMVVDRIKVYTGLENRDTPKYKIGEKTYINFFHDAGEHDF